MFASRKADASGSVPFDRYIPRRRGSSFDVSYLMLLSNSLGDSGFMPNDSSSPNNKEIQNNKSATAAAASAYNSLRTARRSEGNSILNISQNNSSPFSWSSQGIIAVALNQNVTTSKVSNYRAGNQSLDIHTCTLPEFDVDVPLYITAVVWDPEGRYLALGTKDGLTLLEPKSQKILSVHSDKYREISGERLCGLAVSIHEKYLAYSGSSGRLYVTKIQESSHPDLIVKGHISAVKALAFCPWQPTLLASGGGSRDGTIKGHRVTNGVKVFEIPSVKQVKKKKCIHSSQVCSLVWSPATKELISGHGEGDIRVFIWSYPNMEPVGFLHAENIGRVVGLGISPDRTTLATLTTVNESLSLWHIAKESKEQSPMRPKRLANNSLRLASALPGSPLSACIR
ncbi:hypothetical protein LSH36_681g02026 [Paralvinella palmiformis]|uniref:Uncharacterized protein n=1 Tax=Paralvinella palmiformis TaxID=53620 RepID=A0AAD9J3P8_9ANNE|nr:hypothetical protein LSH36_681g02026 [Paralvinella palmiformis]